MNYIFLLQKMLQIFVQSYGKYSIFAQWKLIIGVIYRKINSVYGKTKTLHIQPTDAKF